MGVQSQFRVRSRSMLADTAQIDIQDRTCVYGCEEGVRLTQKLPSSHPADPASQTHGGEARKEENKRNERRTWRRESPHRERKRKNKRITLSNLERLDPQANPNTQERQKLEVQRKERGGKVLMTVESSDRAARTAVETLAEAAVAGDESPAAGARMSLASRLYCYRLGREGTAS